MWMYVEGTDRIEGFDGIDSHDSSDSTDSVDNRTVNPTWTSPFGDKNWR